MTQKARGSTATAIRPTSYEECDLRDYCYYRLFCSTANEAERPNIECFKANEHLTTNKKDERFLYIMYSGLCVEVYSSEEGDERPLSILGASQALNPGAAVRRFDVSANMRFLVDSEVCRLPMSPVSQKLLSNPELGTYLIDALFSTVIGASALIWVYSGTRCIDRIRHLLFLLAYLYKRYLVDEPSRRQLRNLFASGEGKEERCWVEIKVPHSLISSIAHASRPQIKSAFEKLKKEGCVEHSYRNVRVDINHVLGEDPHNLFPIENIDALFPLCDLFSKP
jgi:CRP-like cAMP-binding protein